MIKYSGKVNLRENGLSLTWGFRFQSIPAEKSQWQVWEAAGYIMSPDRMRSSECMLHGDALTYTTQGMVLPTVKIELPASINVIMPVLHRHALRPIAPLQGL